MINEVGPPNIMLHCVRGAAQVVQHLPRRIRTLKGHGTHFGCHLTKSWLSHHLAPVQDLAERIGPMIASNLRDVCQACRGAVKRMGGKGTPAEMSGLAGQG